MLEVNLTTRSGELELGRVLITNIEMHDDDTADYSVQFAVERCGAVGLHQRVIRHFPRTKYNALALLLQALNTLDPKELELEDGTDSSDLARRQRGTLPEIQGGQGPLYHH